MLNYVEGNLLEMAHDFDIIVHGCNCFCTMGAGIAKQIKEKWPRAYIVDRKTIKGDRDKLGDITISYEGSPIIINAYTQYTYGKGNHIDYAAVASAMHKIAKYCDHLDKEIEIGMPKIGSGLAGGDWEKIEEIVKDNLASYYNVTIVNYNSN